MRASGGDQGWTAEALAERCQGQLVAGPADARARDVGPPDAARPGDLVFVHRRAWIATLETTSAAIALIERRLWSDVEPPPVRPGLAVIAVEHARWAFARLVPLFVATPSSPPDRRQHAWLDPSARVDPSASIGPGCVVEAEAEVGPRAVLAAGVHLHRAAVVGEGTVLHDHVVVGADCRVGRRCVLHAGVVVGSAGFGHVRGPDGTYLRVPQLGTVVIEDDVEIGVHSCVDRAAFGVTHVGRGSRIDNLVQVGHGVRIGPDCLLAAQAGVAGSATLHRGAVLAAQSGVADHVQVGAEATVLAQSGVMRDVEPGEVVLGSPASSRVRFLRSMVRTQRLERWFARVRALERAWRKNR
jgi:UDP-3-O-[3-hydroxymyristoyl] glucosamine N-acyltransferase